MREVQASCSTCSSDLDLGQAGRAREGGGGSLCFFLFPLPIVPVVSLLNGMGAVATVNIYLDILMEEQLISLLKILSFIKNLKIFIEYN